MQTIYLDYNATTPVAPEVRDALLPFLGERFGNPSSDHALGTASRQALLEARRQVAGLLGAQPGEVYFTGGGTESNNLAIIGVARAARRPSGHVIISAIEHPATVAPVRFLESLGHPVTVVGVDGRGLVSPQEVADSLRDDTVLVSIMHANNEIGVVQPIEDIAAICRPRGVLVHTDAAQSAGKIETRVDRLGVDLLSIAGHKLYAPKGVGALYVRDTTPIAPVVLGAGQESGLRPGTENVAFAVGLGRAAAVADEHFGEHESRMSSLRDRLLDALRRGIGPDVSINGEGAPRLPNTLSVNLPGVVGGELLARIPQLCASTGAACHSGDTRMSATLAAIGLAPEVARGTLRLSVGWYTTPAEIDQAARWLIDAWHAVS